MKKCSHAKCRDRSKIKTVIFDFDGVFVNKFTTRSVADFCKTFHVSEEAFGAFARKAAVGLDTGKKREADYFGALARKFTVPLSARGMKEFFAARDKRNIKKDHAMYGLLRANRKRVRTALLSNVSRELAGRLRAQGFYKGFGRKFFSYRMGVAKPSPEAYLRVLKGLGVGADEVVFIDDNKQNVEAAKRLGMRTILHRTAAGTASRLRKMLS